MKVLGDGAVYRQVLRDIYEEYGAHAVFNVKRLRAYLLDMRVPKKTINLLADISRIEYFEQFVNEIVTDCSAREKLIYNLENEYAFDRRAVEEGVDCWVYALTGRAAGAAPKGMPPATEKSDDEVWPEETAELVAAALRELMGG